jgi:hypothetical protein
MVRSWIAVVLGACVLAASAAANASSGSEACTREQTKGTFDAFVRAFNSGDRAALDRLVAPAPAFVWFSVSGAGRRLGERSKVRSTLPTYFAGRHAQRDQFRDTTFQGGGHGQFGFLLTRLADDELPSRYEGKGSVLCGDDGNVIEVWSMAHRLTLPVTAPAARLRLAGGHVGSVRVIDSACRGCVQTESRASTIAYRDPPNQLPPHRTMAALPPAGVIVHVTRSWEPSPPAWVRRVQPLRVVPSAVTASFEGNTTRGRVSRWTGTTWRGGSLVTVWVLFGRPTPTAAQIRRAQAVLDHAAFPPWRIGVG